MCSSMAFSSITSNCSSITIYLNLSLFTGIFYVLLPHTVYIKLPNFILFSLENDDMESSKRVKRLSFINLIRISSSSSSSSSSLLAACAGGRFFVFSKCL